MRVTPCHVVKQSRERARLDRLDFLTQLRQRAPADDAQHLRVAPLALRPAGAELAFHEPAALDEALQRLRDHGDAEAVALRDFGRRERAVRAREAEHEIADRVRDRLR